MVSIIDCGMGNLGSVKNMLKHIGAKSKIVSSVEDVNQAEKIILPGVGSWDNGILKLKESGLMDALNQTVIKNKVPVLGICLGMQLLLETSEEGSLAGLGWIPGHVVKFNSDNQSAENPRLRVPHMGWNVVYPQQDCRLINTFEGETRFYFVHSYHASHIKDEHKLLTCHYGYEFVCAIHKENIWGVQFHPEKSHRFGMMLMKNFVEL